MGRYSLPLFYSFSNRNYIVRNLFTPKEILFQLYKICKFYFLITSFILVAVWCIRNLDTGETNTQNTFPDAMDFNHSLLLENNIPIFTSHIPTFLKTIYDKKWHKKPNLLRSDQRDFVELPKFSKILKPSSIDSLIYNDAFYYHYYYSGSHSNIVFDPWQWANENDYSISIINQYPQVTLLKKIIDYGCMFYFRSLPTW